MICRVLRIKLTANGAEVVTDTPLSRVFEPLPNTVATLFESKKRNVICFMFGFYDLSDVQEALAKRKLKGWELDFNDMQLVVTQSAKRSLYLGSSGVFLKQDQGTLHDGFELPESVTIEGPLSLLALQRCHHQP